MKIAFYIGKGLPLNYLIRFYQRCAGKKYWQASHCEVLIEQDEQTDSWVAYGSSAMDNGVRIKHIRIDSEHWKVIDIGEERKEFAINWMKEYMGEAYDYKGILNKLFPWISPSTDKLDCNEAVQAMLGIVGDFVPADLMEMFLN